MYVVHASIYISKNVIEQKKWYYCTRFLFVRCRCIRMRIWPRVFERVPIPFFRLKRQFLRTAVFCAPVRRNSSPSPSNPSKISRSGWDASLVSRCRRVVINLLNGMHIHACVSYAKQDGGSGKYLPVAADIFRENSADGSAILRSSSLRIG